jgi:general secretion pathway protein G
MKSISNIKYKQSLILGKQILKKGFTLISKACKGFTLIELLVVISIIGILATLIMARFGGVEKSARDAKRKSDLNQYRTALENYASIYPISTTLIPDFPVNNICTSTSTPVLSPYIATCPNDPRYGTTGYTYQYQTDTNGLKYIMYAQLEAETNYYYVCSAGKIDKKPSAPGLSDCP